MFDNGSYQSSGPETTKAKFTARVTKLYFGDRRVDMAKELKEPSDDRNKKSSIVNDWASLPNTALRDSDSLVIADCV